MTMAMHNWFIRGLERSPDSPAIQDGSTARSFAEVHHIVSRWARALVTCQRVGVLSQRRDVCYLGILAALYAGATVVPLSPHWPVTRRQRVAQLATIDALITDEDETKWLDTLKVRPLLFGPARQRAAEGLGNSYVADASTMAGPAYIMFTSGSTGDPKGVPISHSNVAAFLSALDDRYHFRPGDVFAQTFEITFDLSIFETFGAWSSGACTCPLSPIQVGNPARCVAERGITVWMSTPSLITMLAESGRLHPGSIPGLRYTVFCGEQLPVRTARAWASAAPRSELDNLYGPTEATVACTGFRVSSADIASGFDDSETVPIGLPFPGVSCLLLGCDGRPDPVRGELCLTGPQVFDGYLAPAPGVFLDCEGKRWYRTGDQVQWSDRHGYVHLGRVDDQVKVNGYRVELAEVETAIRRCRPDAQSAVITVTDTSGLAILGAFISVTQNESGRLRQLRQDLAEELPPYMLPKHLWQISQFPVTLNGKVDRQALRKLAHRLLREGST